MRLRDLLVALGFSAPELATFDYGVGCQLMWTIGDRYLEFEFTRPDVIGVLTDLGHNGSSEMHTFDVPEDLLYTLRAFVRWVLGDEFPEHVESYET